ncbi:hypothetical protein Mal4_55130 [Maioricimonas rarisocia]|uniref:Uncharacterized protein n=1 Tax=Maioricimonas rarisocia TaxID=2528026 RepID=A0A517ZF86_9PLAN|nr:hypothetical protein [Maioricimonas rarisocia]QDU41148.1 hypothetical protein Mal4_55130 [Maioricimonas rarisocia]
MTCKLATPRRTSSQRPARLLLAAALPLALLVSSGWAIQNEEAAPEGLQGIIPEYVPEGLTEEDFATLEGNWAEWAQNTSALVAEFYEGDNAGQPATLERLKVKLGTLEKALNSPRYRSIHPQLSNLYGKLSRRVAVADAILATLAVDPEAARAARVEGAYGHLSDALAGLRSDLRRVSNGHKWLPWVKAEELAAAARSNDTSEEAMTLLADVHRKIATRGELDDAAQRDFLGRPSFVDLEHALADVLAAMNVSIGDDYHATLRDHAGRLVEAIEIYEEDGSGPGAADIREAYNALREVALDGGAAISEAMRAHYYNYNVRIIATEGLMRRFIEETRLESGWINERVTEAHVTGYQCTNATVSIDLKPSRDGALFDITLSGTVNSNATGTTDQARVHIVGNHYFRANKEVRFDGKEFYTYPAHVGVNANNRAVGATTKFSGVPLLGHIADNIAYKEANKRMPQANSAAAGKIYSQVKRQLDSEVDGQFDDAAMKLESDFYGPLRENGLYPDAVHLSSGSDYVLARGRIMSPAELGGQLPAPHAAPPHRGLLLEIHETMLNNAADRMDFAGKTMTEEEVRARLQEKMQAIFGRELDLPEPAPPAEGEDPQNATLVFDEIDPVRFDVSGDTVTIIIRAGLDREGRDDIPTQIITVPLLFSVEGDQIVMDRGNVGVRPVERPSSVAEQVARANVMRSNIQRALVSRTFDSTLDLEIEGKQLKLYVREIAANDGWLTIGAQ